MPFDINPFKLDVPRRRGGVRRGGADIRLPRGDNREFGVEPDNLIGEELAQARHRPPVEDVLGLDRYQ